MTRCLNTADLLDFASRLDVKITIIKEGIILHSETAEVLWRWTGSMWCW